MDYVLLLFVIIDDRLLEKKGQEKKHEKKKIQKQLSIYTCTIQCMYILWLKNREKLLCKWADVYQILMERFHMKSLTSTVFLRTKTIKRRVMWVKQANSLDSLEVELSQFLLRLSYIQSNLQRCFPAPKEFFLKFFSKWESNEPRSAKNESRLPWTGLGPG